MQNTYETNRLLLRPFVPGDASEVQRIAGSPEIAQTTLNVPHPYEDGMAEAWIASLASGRDSGEQFAYAVVLKPEDKLIGTSTIIYSAAHKRAEVAFWVDPHHWNQGYGTEACRKLVDEAFKALDLEKIWGANFADNPASGRIMAKVGMQQEGVLRNHYIRLGRPRDTVFWGLLRDEWAPKRPTPSIRKAARDDAPRLAEIHVFGWRSAYRGIVADHYLFGKLSVAKREASFQSAIELEEEETYVFEEGGMIKAFLTVGPCRDDDRKNAFEVWGLYVDPGFTRRRIGSAMVRFAHSLAVSRDFSLSSLWVLAKNEATISFYRSHGYCIEGTHQAVDFLKAEVVRMERKL